MLKSVTQLIFKLFKFLANGWKYHLKVSILNGIVMGGGAGVSIHGRFRVATENSVFVSSCFEICVFLFMLRMHIFNRLTNASYLTYYSLKLICSPESPHFSYRFLQCLKRLWGFSQILVPLIFYQDSLDSLVINWHPSVNTQRFTI